MVVNKVSDISVNGLAEYMRIAEPTQEDRDFIATSYAVAVDYILKYTGISDAAELDKYTDMIIAVYVLCQDMYDTRALYVDDDNVNKVVDTILGMHQRNLL